VVVIASGDLSHHLTPDAPAGYDPRGKVFDEALMDILKDFDLVKLYSLDRELIDAAGECGLRSIWIMVGSLDHAKVEPQVLSYEGPFGVGYGIAKFPCIGEGKGRWDELSEAHQKKRNLLRSSESPYVKWARQALETYVIEGTISKIPEDLPAEMLRRRAGVFVSLKKDGELRGCIGTFMPTRDNVSEEILHNAIAAGTEDPRFHPVTPEELEDIVYSVDVLTSPEPVDSLDQLDPKRYGVIVKKGYRTGLLLPDLEGVDTVEEQLKIALQKAGIWPEKGYKIERFEVERHS
jgi:AmmeMemoRadiSam system protein A